MAVTPWRSRTRGRSRRRVRRSRVVLMLTLVTLAAMQIVLGTGCSADANGGPGTALRPFAMPAAGGSGVAVSAPPRAAAAPRIPLRLAALEEGRDPAAGTLAARGGNDPDLGPTPRTVLERTFSPSPWALDATLTVHERPIDHVAGRGRGAVTQGLQYDLELLVRDPADPAVILLRATGIGQATWTEARRPTDDDRRARERTLPRLPRQAFEAAVADLAAGLAAEDAVIVSMTRQHHPRFRGVAATEGSMDDAAPTP